MNIEFCRDELLAPFLVRAEGLALGYLALGRFGNPTHQRRRSEYMVMMVVIIRMLRSGYSA